MGARRGRVGRETGTGLVRTRLELQAKFVQSCRSCGCGCLSSTNCFSKLLQSYCGQAANWLRIALFSPQLCQRSASARLAQLSAGELWCSKVSPNSPERTEWNRIGRGRGGELGGGEGRTEETLTEYMLGGEPMNLLES